MSTRDVPQASCEFYNAAKLVITVAHFKGNAKPLLPKHQLRYGSRSPFRFGCSEGTAKTARYRFTEHLRGPNKVIHHKEVNEPLRHDSRHAEPKPCPGGNETYETQAYAP